MKTRIDLSGEDVMEVSVAILDILSQCLQYFRLATIVTYGNKN